MNRNHLNKSDEEIIEVKRSDRNKAYIPSAKKAIPVTKYFIAFY